MESSNFEDDTPHFNLREHLLNSPDKGNVGTGITFVLEDAIIDLLPIIANNFTPAECTDIVSNVLNKITADQEFAQYITHFVQGFQAGSKNTPSTT